MGDSSHIGAPILEKSPIYVGDQYIILIHK